MEGNGETGALEAFAQPRGDEADDAGMPIGGGQNEDGRALARADLGFGYGHGFGDGLDLDALALVVEFVELGSDDHGLMLIVERQQARAQGRIADASAG